MSENTRQRAYNQLRIIAKRKTISNRRVKETRKQAPHSKNNNLFLTKETLISLA